VTTTSIATPDRPEHGRHAAAVLGAAGVRPWPTLTGPADEVWCPTVRATADLGTDGEGRTYCQHCGEHDHKAAPPVDALADGIATALTRWLDTYPVQGDRVQIRPHVKFGGRLVGGLICRVGAVVAYRKNVLALLAHGADIIAVCPDEVTVLPRAGAR
jgi:hypothetical protein